MNPQMPISATEVQPTDNGWYAFRVYGGHTEAVVRDADRRGYESYIPMHVVERNVFGRKVKCQRPLIASLVFLRADREYVCEVHRNPMNGASVYRLPGSDEPSPISDSEMALFRRVTEIGAENIEVVDEGLAVGEKVCVTEGVFKGCVGRKSSSRGGQNRGRGSSGDVVYPQGVFEED